MFWPDQARAHYAKSVINYLKNDNPVNVLKCCPIKNFWAISKQQV